MAVLRRNYIRASAHPHPSTWSRARNRHRCCENGAMSTGPLRLVGPIRKSEQVECIRDPDAGARCRGRSADTIVTADMLQCGLISGSEVEGCDAHPRVRRAGDRCPGRSAVPAAATSLKSEGCVLRGSVAGAFNRLWTVQADRIQAGMRAAIRPAARGPPLWLLRRLKSLVD